MVRKLSELQEASADFYGINKTNKIASTLYRHEIGYVFEHFKSIVQLLHPTHTDCWKIKELLGIFIVLKVNWSSIVWESFEKVFSVLSCRINLKPFFALHQKNILHFSLFNGKENFTFINFINPRQLKHDKSDILYC